MRESIHRSVADGASLILRFANCELDLARVTLRRDGREIKLEPQAFDVLCYLVEHRERSSARSSCSTTSGATGS